MTEQILYKNSLLKYQGSKENDSIGVLFLNSKNAYCAIRGTKDRCLSGVEVSQAGVKVNLEGLDTQDITGYELWKHGLKDEMLFKGKVIFENEKTQPVPGK